MARRYIWQSTPVPLMVTFLTLWSCHPLLPIMAQLGEMTEVRAVNGQRVIIPCAADSPEATGGSDVSYILFSFVTPRGPTRIYRVNNIGSGKVTHWAANSYASRALVDWQPGVSPARLVLDGAGLADQGIYGCHVSTASSTFIMSTVNLSVFAPPTSLRIYSDLKPDTEIKGIVGPYDLEEMVTFSCRVKGGHPRPNVTWWEGSRLLEDTHVTHTDLTHSATIRSDITVGPLTRQDLHRNLTCRAFNSDLYDSLETSLTLDLRYPPSSIRIVGEKDGQVAVRAGRRQEVVCEVHSGRPTPSITLRLDQDLLSSRSDTKEELEMVTSTAVLVPREEQDGSLVTCVVDIPPFHPALSVRLAVLYPPRVKVLFGRNLKAKYVNEGDDFDFRCDVTAKPSVSGVKWTLNGEPLLNNPSHGVNAEGFDLHLEGVSRSSSGEYRCSAINSVGEGVSDPLYLKVRAKPEAVTSCSVSSDIPPESKTGILEVKCVAKADGDLSKIFQLEVKRVGRSKAEKRQHQHRPVFSIKGLREGQYQLSVTASNDLGDSPPYTFNHTIHAPISSSSSSSISSSSSSSSSSSIPSSASSSSISVFPSLTSSSVSITALSSAPATSGASSISPTPSLLSFSLSTSFSSPISPHATNSFTFKTPPPPSSSNAFLPSPPPASRSPWKNPWAVLILVMVALTAIAHVGFLVPKLLVSFFVAKLERRPPRRQRLPSPRFPRRRSRNSIREHIRAHRLSDPPMQLPTITISPPASAPSTPLSIRKGSLTLDYSDDYNFIGSRRAPHASVDSLELSSLSPSLQNEQLDTYSVQDELLEIEQSQNGTLPRARPHNGSVSNEPLLNNNFQDAFLTYNFIEKESLQRDLLKRPRSRPATPNFLSVGAAAMKRPKLKEPSYKA